MVNNQIFPKFALRNQNIKVMEITIYGPDKSIVSNKVIELNIPGCYKEYNIHTLIGYYTTEESKLLARSRVKYSNAYFIDRLKFSIKYDYTLFCDSQNALDINDVICSDSLLLTQNTYNSIKDVVKETNWVEALLSYSITQMKENWGNATFNEYQLFRYVELMYLDSNKEVSWIDFKKSLSVKDVKACEEFHSNSDMMYQTSLTKYILVLKYFVDNARKIVYGMPKSESRRINEIKQLLSLIHPGRGEFSVVDFENVSTIAKIAELYYKDPTSKSELFNLIYINNQLVGTVFPHLLVNFIFRKDSKKYRFLFGDGSEIKVNTEIEEDVYLRVSGDNSNEEIQYIKSILTEKYDEHISKYKEDIEKQTQAYYLRKIRQPSKTKWENWEELFYKGLDDLDIKITLVDPKTIQYQTYVLLLNNTQIENNEVINNQIVKDLLYIGRNFEYVMLDEIFDNLYSFDYIRKQIGNYGISDTCTNIDKDPFVLEKDGYVSSDIDEALDRINNFIHPILNASFIEEIVENNNGQGRRKLSIEPDVFKQKMKKLFISNEEENDDEDECRRLARKELRDNIIKNHPSKHRYGFNLMLLFNIIGALSTREINTSQGVVSYTRIFQDNKANTIMRTLLVKRKLVQPTSSTRHYISDYTDRIEFGQKGHSLLTIETLSYIQDTFGVVKDIFKESPPKIHTRDW